ncbi:phosphoribosyltransferase [Amycolatopsis anabasis]|uniref:phosphoribosyltransferase n=1 Tax=Amycolatopsis anabasis TaxID=1840409 RepID=UPI00131D546F|nr:phosphoribosyltransferase family protein [Amycolatopsis anabasis]
MRSAMSAQVFPDRREAGRRLAARLRERRWFDPVVLGLPRGGVPVAAPVAEALGAPLDVVVARKIGAPDQPEFGVGAVTASGPPYYDERSLDLLGLTRQDLAKACEEERAEARRRMELYRNGYQAARCAGRAVIVIDDGLATGVTATAALRAVRDENPRELVFAAPVCARDGAVRLRDEADGVVCLEWPELFLAVGQWYEDFPQTSDNEVIGLLENARDRRASE